MPYTNPTVTGHTAGVSTNHIIFPQNKIKSIMLYISIIFDQF